MAEERKQRKYGTEAAAKVPGIVREVITAGLRAKEEGKPVAYCFAYCGYDEICRAMDIVPVWTENYAAICGIKRDAVRFLEKAETENFSRSLCTYATCGLGFDIWREELGAMPPDPPWGGQAKPDVMLGSGWVICEPRYKWYQAAQHFMPDVPVYVVGQLLPEYDENIPLNEVQDYYVKYMVAEFRGLVSFLEKHLGKKMDWDRLSELVDLSDRTWNTMWEAYELRRAVPTPMDSGDAMNTMVPLTYLLGTQQAYDFYQDLYRELKYKVDNRIGVVPEEKYRLLWGHTLPPWFALTDFEYFNRKGAVFPVEIAYRTIEPIYHMALPEVSDPLEHLAWRLFKRWTHWYGKTRKRPGSFPPVERMLQYIDDYKIDGVVMHMAFSCRSWHLGLLWQLDLLKKLYGEIPSLILESDMVDVSSYSEADTHNRIDAFIETLEAAKSRAR
ncbi:2-hydroxyacyl-CoA dehydratase subunit D [Chloroflexota bacterium]